MGLVGAKLDKIFRKIYFLFSISLPIMQFLILFSV